MLVDVMLLSNAQDDHGRWCARSSLSPLPAYRELFGTRPRKLGTRPSSPLPLEAHHRDAPVYLSLSTKKVRLPR